MMAVIALWAVVMGAWLAPQRDALAIEREMERLAASRSFWPGYDPLAIPLAVYDGERTFLFRHPSPPEGFTAKLLTFDRLVNALAGD